MYAVIAHSGLQFRVSEGDEVLFDQISAEAGSTIDISEVLLIGGDKVKVGNPTVKGAKVTFEVLGNELGDKRSTFKYRRTRRSRVRKAQRPSFTRVKVTKIKA
jgi:large subunit ribosomal protein L21